MAACHQPIQIRQEAVHQVLGGSNAGGLVPVRGANRIVLVFHMSPGLIAVRLQPGLERQPKCFGDLDHGWRSAAWLLCRVQLLAGRVEFLPLEAARLVLPEAGKE